MKEDDYDGKRVAICADVYKRQVQAHFVGSKPPVSKSSVNATITGLSVSAAI